jgi:hypothetical protein
LALCCGGRRTPFGAEHCFLRKTTAKQRHELGKHRRCHCRPRAIHEWIYIQTQMPPASTARPEATTQDVVVHRFDEIGQTNRRIYREAAVATKVGDVNR